MRTYLASVAFVAANLGPGIAFAQISGGDESGDSVPVESDPMPADPAPAAAPAPVAAPAPAAEAAPAAAQDDDESDESDEYETIGADGGPRFRWGVSGMFGPSFGVSPVAVFGADMRFGAQINDIFGFYAQPMFMLGAGFSTDQYDEPRSFGQALVGMAAMLDLTFSDFIYVAAGPEYVTGVVGLRHGVSSDYGPFFSIASRLGVVLGKKKKNHRRGLALGLDTRVIFVDSGMVVTPLFTAGFESF